MSPERLKAACVSVRAPARHGTAYLVAPTTLATCHHVVESAGKGGEVELLFPGGVRTARVVETDERTDCAILQLAEPLPGGEPLPLAGRSEGRAQWDGFGFPSLAAGAGLPLPPPLFERTPPEAEQANAFERCNAAIIDEAERLATLFDDADPVLLTVWNGNPGDASGGTAHAVAVWRQRDRRAENVDVGSL